MSRKSPEWAHDLSPDRKALAAKLEPCPTTIGPNMLETLTRLIGDERGATAIEYGLLAALVTIAGIAAMTSLGVSLESLFNLLAGQIDNAHRCVQVGSNCGN